MPKVSTKEVRVYTESTSRLFKIDIIYSSASKFHAKVPDEFNEVLRIMPSNEKYKLFVVALPVRGKYHSEDFIFAESEKDLEDRFYGSMKKLIEKNVVKREVILLHMKTGKVHSFYHTSNGHEMSGLEMGICYATEVTAGEHKKYAIFTENKGWRTDEVTITRNDINKDVTKVIDDTPANRKRCVELYNAFIVLKDKLKELTDSDDLMLLFLQGNHKLLN